VTAGEDQSKLVIGKGFDLGLSIVFRCVQGRSLGILVLSFAVAPESVDCPIAGSSDDPSCGRRRDTFLRPLLEGDEKGILDCFFGEVDVTKRTNQGGAGLPGLFPKDTFDLSVAGPRQVSPPVRA
jgi:hypothetical protein